MSQALRRGIWVTSWARNISTPTPLRHGWQTRCVQIRAAPSQEPATVNGSYLPIANTQSSAESRDARFDVIGSPYSLLSVSLSASQNLYTRRGTLVGLSGKADNVVSTLSVLEPFRRAPLGIPFLYQKVSSASPVTALVSTRSPVTSFSVVHLNGSEDWVVAQRRALLAWTGRSLTVKPIINTSLSLAHWGSSEVTGRGLLALVGSGQLYNVELKAGEQYIAHPSNVVAYTMTSNPPRPYRFKSTNLKFQVPGIKTLPSLVQKSEIIRNLSNSDWWKTTMGIFHELRTWSRRTIWGDRLFLQFDGPATILMQSRGPRINDIMSAREVNEIADSTRGLTVGPAEVTDKEKLDQFKKEAKEVVDSEPAPRRSVEGLTNEVKGTTQNIAKLTEEGKVVIEKVGQTK